MKNKLWFVLLTVVCLLISFSLRQRFYWLHPQAQDSFDEFASAWAGISLLNRGIPASWSFHPYYKNEALQGKKLDLIQANIAVDGLLPTLGNYREFPRPVLLTRELEVEGYRSHFNLVQPWLDQPPLGPILVSLLPFFQGKTDLTQIGLKDLRLPFVFLGALNTLLVILLAKKWYGEKAALISGFVWATVPTMVLGSRMALPDNLIAFLFLLFALNLDQGKEKFLYLICFLAPLIKPFGLAIPLAGAAYSFLAEKNFKKVMIYFLIGGLSMLVYFLYGAYYDQQVLLNMLRFQSQRFFPGPQTFIYKFLIPKITKIFLDGWIVFGWLAVFVIALSRQTKKHLGLLVCLFSYAFFLTFFGGEDYGWYRLPFYPFLAIATGYLLNKMIQKPAFFSSLLFVLIPFSTSLYWGLGLEDWTNQLLYFRLFLIISVLFFLVKKTAKGYLMALLILALVFNFLAIRQTEKFWPRLGDTSSLIIYRK